MSQDYNKDEVLLEDTQECFSVELLNLNCSVLCVVGLPREKPHLHGLCLSFHGDRAAVIQIKLRVCILSRLQTPETQFDSVTNYVSYSPGRISYLTGTSSTYVSLRRLCDSCLNRFPSVPIIHYWY